MAVLSTNENTDYTYLISLHHVSIHHLLASLISACPTSHRQQHLSFSTTRLFGENSLQRWNLSYSSPLSFSTSIVLAHSCDTNSKLSTLLNHHSSSFYFLAHKFFQWSQRDSLRKNLLTCSSHSRQKKFDRLRTSIQGQRWRIQFTSTVKVEHRLRKHSPRITLLVISPCVFPLTRLKEQR